MPFWGTLWVGGQSRTRVQGLRLAGNPTFLLPLCSFSAREKEEPGGPFPSRPRKQPEAARQAHPPARSPPSLKPNGNDARLSGGEQGVAPEMASHSSHCGRGIHEPSQVNSAHCPDCNVFVITQLCFWLRKVTSINRERPVLSAPGLILKSPALRTQRLAGCRQEGGPGTGTDPNAQQARPRSQTRRVHAASLRHRQ